LVGDKPVIEMSKVTAFGWYDTAASHNPSMAWL
jgi:hypothetical protein